MSWVTGLFWIGVKNALEAMGLAYRVIVGIRGLQGRGYKVDPCEICGQKVGYKPGEAKPEIIICVECFPEFRRLVGLYLQRHAGFPGKLHQTTAASIADFVRTTRVLAWTGDDFFIVDLKGEARKTFNRPPFERGALIDGGFDRMGLPFNFPVIDIWDKLPGQITSIKSYDLSASTYQSLSTLNGVIHYDARKVAEYTEGKGIGANEIKRRVLLAVVPLMGSTDTQINYLYTLTVENNKNPFRFQNPVQVVVFVVD